MNQRMGDLLVNLDLNSSQFVNEISAARNQLRGVGVDANSATGYLDAMKRSAMGLTGILAGTLSVGSVITTADEWGQLSSRLLMAAGSADELAEAQRRLMEISDRTFKPIEEQTELYIRNASAMRELGYSSSESIDYIDSISSLLTINAASAQKAESAINALSKATVAGKVSGQNWRTILETMPTITADIARHLGVTENAVKELASAGKLSFKDFSEAIIAAREENARLAEEMPTTVSDAITKLSNHWKAYIGDANAATGATATLANGIGLLADNLDLVVIAGQSLALGVGAKYLLTMANNARIASLRSLDVRKATISVAESQLQAAQTTQHRATMARRLAESEAIAAVNTDKSRIAALALVQARNREAIAINAVTAAQTRLNVVSSTGRALGAGLLGLLGGPVGLAAMAISVAAGFLLMRDNTNDARQALLDISEPVDSLIEKYKELNEVQRTSVRQGITESLKGADEELRKAEAAFERYIKSISTTLIYAGPGVQPIEMIDEKTQSALNTLLATLNEVKGSAGSINDLSGYLQSSVNAFLDATNASEAQRKQLQELTLGYVEGRSKTEDYIEKLRALTGVTNEATAAQRNLANVVVVDFSKQISNASLALDVSKVAARGASKEADLLRNAYAAAGEQAAELAPMIKEIVAARGELEVPPEFVGLKTWVQLQAQIQDNNEAAKEFSNTVKTGDSDAKKLNDSFVKRLASQRQQIELHGKVTELSRLEYELSKGELSTLTEAQKQALSRNAIELDRLSMLDRYKSLTEELRTPEEKSLAIARERLQLLKDANVSAEEQANIQKRIADDMATAAPTFGGIDASIGGAAGELFKIAESQRLLEEWHAKQLEMWEVYYSEHEGMEQEHADRIAAINSQLAKRQEQIQFASTKTMLSIFSEFTSGSMELLSAMGEEGSAVYKAMFLVNKAAAVANAIVSAHVAAAKAREIGPQFGGEAFAQTTLALGYANAAMIASTTIAGMAHDGIDFIPSDGTWLLQKGERVVDSRTNADLKSFLSAKSDSGEFAGGFGGINITQYIEVSGSGDEALIAAMEEAASRGAEGGAVLALQNIQNDFMTNGPARRLLNQ